MITALLSRPNLEQLSERIVPSSTSAVPGTPAPPPAQVYPAAAPADDNGQASMTAEPELEEWLREQWEWVKGLVGVDYGDGTQAKKTVALTPPPHRAPVVPAPPPFGTSGEPQPGTLEQGALGDCWFIATLEALVRTNPQAIKDMIQVNPDGTYTVTFPGRPPVTVTYNPIAGVDSEGVEREGATSNGIWARILEQAAAQIIKQEIENGAAPRSAIDLLLGAGTWFDSNSNHRTKGNSSIGTFRDKIRSRVDANGNVTQIVVASNLGPTKNGIIGSHSYTVIGYDAATDRVKVRNPHNGGSNHLGEPTTNGEFWMTMEEFYEHFDRIDYQD